MKVLFVRTLYSFCFNLHLLVYVHDYTNTFFWGLPFSGKYFLNNFRFTISAKSAVIPGNYLSLVKCLFKWSLFRFLTIELIGEYGSHVFLRVWQVLFLLGHCCILFLTWPKVHNPPHPFKTSASVVYQTFSFPAVDLAVLVFILWV